MDAFYPPVFAAQLAQSPELEHPPSCRGHEAEFDVKVRVQRSFSFEELQSGSYLASLDESDIQFYRVYGQPVLIPPPDEDDANFVFCATGPTAAASLPGPYPGQPPILSSKSYTLQNPLGDARGQRIYSAPQLPHSRDWQLVKQEPNEGVTTFYNPAFPDLSCQLYTLPDQDDGDLTVVASPADDKQSMISIYDEPPMDSLPYPPANAASPPFFQVPPPPQSMQDHVVQGPFDHGASFQMSGHNHWEEAPGRTPRLAAQSQSYMLSELPSSSTAFSQMLPQQYTSSSTTCSHRRHSRSPSPQSGLRLSPTPHTKRSLDKKPALACLFCRGRKIACGPPQPGTKDKTCNQCARRHLKCEYPLESRRGMRKRRSLIPRTSSTSPETNPDGSRVGLVKASRKRSVDKSS